MPRHPHFPMFVRLAAFFAVIAGAFVLARLFAANLFNKGGELFGRGDAVFFLAAWAICVVGYYGAFLVSRLFEHR